MSAATDGRRSLSRRFPVRKLWIVFLALAVSLLVTLVRINVSLIVSRNEQGAELTIHFGPIENQYNAGASPWQSSTMVVEAQTSTRNASLQEPIPGNKTIAWPESNNTDTSNTTEQASQNSTKIKITGKRKQKDMPLERDILIEDGPVFPVPIVNPDTQNFDPNIKGVIVTKIQGYPVDLMAAKQMLCLLTKAYNHRVHHDIVVFTSIPIETTEIEAFRALVHPANLTVAVDNPGLNVTVLNLSPERRQHLLDRCNVTSVKELRWRTKCLEESSNKKTKDTIAYTWQAEFRALWIWTHPLLEPYKYMMWMDSDAFCTRAWKQDPFAAMERHDLALLFDHFPQGRARGYEFPRLTKQVFDREICGIRKRNGTLVALDGNCKNRRKTSLHNVHGFFHVSSLDFYRSEAVARWSKAMIGDHKFSRLFDDQIGITIPAAVLAGNRSREMGSIGIYPRVYHNYFLDGRKSNWRGAFSKWWQRNAEEIFPEASGTCEITIAS